VKYILRRDKYQQDNPEAELLQVDIELWCWEVIKNKVQDSLIWPKNYKEQNINFKNKRKW
jgi:hypothetical protein